jgi:mannose-6-phosphate isomerase-like protein (cupin superfamily)
MNSENDKWVLGHKVTPLKTTGDFDLVLGETPGHTPGPPPHFHKNFNEVFIVTEGEMEFVRDGKPQTLKAGESINLEPFVVHTFANNSDQTCKWVNIHSPKGFLQFFENIGIASNEENAQHRSLAPEKIQEVIQNAVDYDMILQLP